MNRAKSIRLTGWWVKLQAVSELLLYRPQKKHRHVEPDRASVFYLEAFLLESMTVKNKAMRKTCIYQQVSKLCWTCRRTPETGVIQTAQCYITDFNIHGERASNVTIATLLHISPKNYKLWEVTKFRAALTQFTQNVVIIYSAMSFQSPILN